PRLPQLLALAALERPLTTPLSSRRPKFKAMKTREPAEVAMPVGPSPARDLRHRTAAVGSSLAGPAVIATSVLIVLRAFAFRGMLTAQHPDLLSTFLPSWCFLGRSLASGHIPAWNPHVMGGVPFAGDP